MDKKISIKAEPLFHIGDFLITNAYLTSLIVSLILIITAIWYAKMLEKSADKRPALFYFIQGINMFLYDLVKSIFGSRRLEVFFSIISAFFIYILIQNWFGLLPGVGSITIKVIEEGEKMKFPLFRGGTADLNTTLALALASVIITQYYGIKYLGFSEYIKKFFNLKGPIEFFTGVLETISEFSKVVSFAFRLFGNIFAGEVMLIIIASLVPILASFPFLLLEIFVGLIQALVFAMLTAVFISGAIEKHH